MSDAEMLMTETPLGRLNIGHGHVHAHGRTLIGRDEYRLDLPLCWDMEGKQRGATDEEWWISVDHGAIDANEQVLILGSKSLITCPDCLEWMHA